MELLNSIQHDMRQRMKELEPVVAEYKRLEAAELALAMVIQDNPTPTPYGVKADGTPRRRPGRRRGAQHPTEAPAAAEKPARRPQEARINVLSSTEPTPAELEDREIVHTTEEPA